MTDRDLKVLESYLGALDRSLAKLSTSDRAEIITEIKGHVLDAMERESDRTLDSVLSSLGEPEAVANKYLLERGLSPGRASKTPVVKWVTIGFLGTFAMGIVLLIVLLTFFSPLIDVDEKAGRVRILGGLIKVDGDVSESSTISFGDGGQIVESEYTISNDKAFRLVFSDGKVKIKNSDNAQITWRCELSDYVKPSEREEAGLFELDLSQSGGANCDVFIPALSNFEIQGSSGKIEMDDPKNETNIVLMNGKVELDLEDQKDYEFDLRLARGVTKGFPPSVPGGLKIIVNLSNGVIEAD